MPQPVMPNASPVMTDITTPLPSSRQLLRQRLRSMSDVATMMRRRSLWQRPDTMPPGAFGSVAYAPQVPRRAISARFETRNAARERLLRHLSSDTDLKAKKGLDAEGKRLQKEDRAFIGPSQESDGEEESTESEIPQTYASSRKSRAWETLGREQLARLRMDFVGSELDFVGSETDNFVGSEPEDFEDLPQSTSGTLLELYAVPERQPDRFSPTRTVNGRRESSTPISLKAPSPFPRPQTRSSDKFVVDGDPEGLHQTRMHMTDPIHLEKHPSILRKDSVATSDSFPSEVDLTGRRPSDLMALEQIVVYFDGMGLIEKATDKCLDRYWLNGQQQALQEMDSGVMEFEPLSPRNQRSKHSFRDASNTVSEFPSSSASSGAPVLQGPPQKRQLIRLRRLLSPALPGSKGSEN